MSAADSIRVVVTGLGIISANGLNVNDFFTNIRNGRVTIGAVTGFDIERFSVNRGAEIKDFDISAFFPDRKDLCKLGRAKQMALAAAKQCIEDANYNIAANALRVGVVIGTTSGESKSLEQCSDRLARHPTGELPLEELADYLPYSLPLAVAKQFGAGGPNLMIPNACAAGNFAIGQALDCIRFGECDAMIAGGSEAFSRYTYAGFARLGAIASDVPRPFSVDRQGMVPGEGAALLFIESLASALARGAHIYAEIVGYGESCDAYHITQPDDKGIARAIQSALRAAALDSHTISYVLVHGTGTPTNDTVETRALKQIFGTDVPPFSSVKSMIGHAMGAASAIECVAALLSIHHQYLTPTMNFTTLDDATPLDCVPNRGRAADVECVLKTASAFGGNNSAIIFKRFSGVEQS